jgi:hypothetical protein
MARKIAHFLAIALLAFVPGGAHLAEMAVKMGLTQESYFTVQQIYRGWSLFGIAIFARSSPTSRSPSFYATSGSPSRSRAPRPCCWS